MKFTKNVFINFFIISSTFLFSGSNSIFANEVSEIRAMTKEKVDIVISTLKDNNLSKYEKKEAILKTIDGLFDFPRMAKLSLGKKHWKSLSKDGRKEFSKLFVEKLFFSL